MTNGSFAVPFKPRLVLTCSQLSTKKLFSLSPTHSIACFRAHLLPLPQLTLIYFSIVSSPHCAPMKLTSDTQSEESVSRRDVAPAGQPRAPSSPQVRQNHWTMVVAYGLQSQVVQPRSHDGTTLPQEQLISSLHHSNEEHSALRPTQVPTSSLSTEESYAQDTNKDSGSYFSWASKPKPMTSSQQSDTERTKRIRLQEHERPPKKADCSIPFSDSEKCDRCSKRNKECHDQSRLTTLSCVYCAGLKEKCTWLAYTRRQAITENDQLLIDRQLSQLMSDSADRLSS